LKSHSTTQTNQYLKISYIRVGMFAAVNPMFKDQNHRTLR